MKPKPLPRKIAKRKLRQMVKYLEAVLGYRKEKSQKMIDADPRVLQD